MTTRLEDRSYGIVELAVLAPGLVDSDASDGFQGALVGANNPKPRPKHSPALVLVVVDPLGLSTTALWGTKGWHLSSQEWVVMVSPPAFFSAAWAHP
jgi:hypothetical protein